jgi:hypothetical protein
MSSSESEGEEGDNRKYITPSLNIQKALIQALEREGGLHIPKLLHICNSRPNLFGHRNTPERKGVQGKVRDWKKNEESYELLKEQFGLTRLRNPTVAVEMSSYSSPPVSSKKASRTSSGATSSAKKLFIDEDSLNYGTYSFVVTSVSFVSFSMTIDHEAHHSLHIHLTVFIDEKREVSVERPEANRDLLVVKFIDDEVKGRRVNGFGCLLIVDPKDVEDNLIKLTFHPCTNGIMLSKPSLHGVFRRYFKTYMIVSKKSKKGYVERFEKELQSAKISIEDDENRESYDVLHVFPDEYPITNKIYTEGATDTEGEEVSYVLQLVPTKSNGNVGVLKFFLAIDEATPRFYRKLRGTKSRDKGKAAMAEALKMLEGITIGDDDGAGGDIEVEE